MGYEYRLQLDLTNHEQADQVLRGIPGFVQFNEGLGLYSFRRESTGVMPDVDAKLEGSGIILCSYGGASGLVTEILAAFAALGFHPELEEL